MGEISLRRRRDPPLDVDVYEVKLGDEFLMSSLFTVAEIELARLGLAAVRRAPTSTSRSADSASATPRAPPSTTPGSRSLIVVDALAEVIDWHRARPAARWPPG